MEPRPKYHPSPPFEAFNSKPARFDNNLRDRLSCYLFNEAQFDIGGNDLDTVGDKFLRAKVSSRNRLNKRAGKVPEDLEPTKNSVSQHNNSAEIIMDSENNNNLIEPNPLDTLVNVSRSLQLLREFVRMLQDEQDENCEQGFYQALVKYSDSIAQAVDDATLQLRNHQKSIPAGPPANVEMLPVNKPSPPKESTPKTPSILHFPYRYTTTRNLADIKDSLSFLHGYFMCQRLKGKDVLLPLQVCTDITSRILAAIRILDCEIRRFQKEDA